MLILSADRLEFNNRQSETRHRCPNSIDGFTPKTNVSTSQRFMGTLLLAQGYRHFAVFQQPPPFLNPWYSLEQTRGLQFPAVTSQPFLRPTVAFISFIRPVATSSRVCPTSEAHTCVDSHFLGCLFPSSFLASQWRVAEFTQSLAAPDVNVGQREPIPCDTASYY